MTNNNYPSRQRSTQRHQCRLLHVLSLIFALLILPARVWGETQPTTGNGTDSNPYVIMSTENLRWVFLNNCSAKLGADLIGDRYYELTVSNNSTVKLDLDGHSIRNTYTSSVNDSPDAKGQVSDILKKVKIVKFGDGVYFLQDFACYSEFYSYLCTQYN